MSRYPCDSKRLNLNLADPSTEVDHGNQVGGAKDQGQHVLFSMEQIGIKYPFI